MLGGELLSSTAPEVVLLRVLRGSWAEIMSRTMRRGLPEGLTPQQLFVLGHLCRHRAQPSELARWQHVGPSAISSLVDGLVARGLIERQQDPSDRRAVLLSVTDVGRRIVEQGLGTLLEAVQQLLEPLSEEERQQLVDALLLFERVAGLNQTRGENGQVAAVGMAEQGC